MYEKYSIKFILFVIIWQGSLGVNPGVLIGSFLVGILPYGPFPWKWSEDVYFLFSKAGNFETSITRVPYNKLLTNLGSFLVGILPYGPFPWKWSEDVYFLFSKAGNFETSITRVPYNKLLTNLACSSRTGEYWPSVVFARPRANIPQYDPRARLVRGYYSDSPKRTL